MAGEIIRLGDRTSHNGIVVEGSQLDICMGKPIAYIGHKVYCPKCQGSYPIVEGVMTTTFYGKGVALAGMKTSCGAILIAGQFTDTVDWGGSARTGRGAAVSSRTEPVPAPDLANSTAAGFRESSMVASGLAVAGENFDEQFVLLDDEGLPLGDVPYTIKLGSGETVRLITDSEGKTIRSATTDAQSIEVYLGHEVQ